MDVLAEVSDLAEDTADGGAPLALQAIVVGLQAVDGSIGRFGSRRSSDAATAHAAKWGSARNRP